MTINTVATFACFVFLYCISKETVLSVAVSNCCCNQFVRFLFESGFYSGRFLFKKIR